VRGLSVAVETPPDLETRGAEEVLAYAVERFHPQLALACSFQKEESVLLDMLMRIEPSARVFCLDTHVLFPETYETWREFEKRWGVKVDVVDVLPDPGTVPEGEPTWTRERCCTERKVDALQEALKGTEAWITGLRREQSPTRADAAKFEWDQRNGLWKFNPIADWDERALWRYISEHDVPYNPLHDRGYASIGCASCTLPGSGREGRWAGEDKTECGLHGEA
jgi:phosphoadenosine phosphosulfate reductase